MESDNNNIVNGIVGLVKSDLRPDKLIAPGTSNQEDREFRFQSRLLSELRDIKEVILGAEKHLERIESLIEGTYTSQPNKTAYRANKDVEVPNYETRFTRAEPSNPIDVEVVMEPPAVRGERGLVKVGQSAVEQSIEAETQTTPALPYEEPKLLGSGDNLLPVLAPDMEIEVQDWDKGLKCFRDLVKTSGKILDIIRETYVNGKKGASDTEVLSDDNAETPSNLALMKRDGYNDVEIPGVQTIYKKRREPKWMKALIGSSVALMGMGELDDHFGNGITNWLYEKASGFKDGKDIRYPYGKPKTIEAEPDKARQEAQKRKAFEDMLVHGKKGYDPKKDKRWKNRGKVVDVDVDEKPRIAGLLEDAQPVVEEEKGQPIDVEVVPDEASVNTGEQEGFVELPNSPVAGLLGWNEEKQNDRVAGLLEEINERVQDIDPMTPTQMEDVLDKQRAEEEAVASMGERLDGEDIKTDVYEEGFARQEKNDDENQKGLLDALGGIGDLLKSGGPIMGVLSTIGTTLAVLGTAVGGFIAGWKLEEYLDAKFDVVNKSLAGIDNTLGTSLFTTAEEKAEKEFEANKGETMQEFTATDYGKQWENLQSSRRQLAQENKELDERIKKGDKVAERLKEKNLQRDKEYSEKMQDLAVLRDASEDENYEANIQKEIEDMNEALENGTWNDLYDNQGFSYDSKERLESDLKLKKEVLDRLHKLQQKDRDKEIEANKLKEGEEYEKLHEEGPSNEELKSAWANALPDKSSKELENGEPKLNPVSVPGVEDEMLTELIQDNRQDAANKLLADALKEGSKTQQLETQHSNVTSINGNTFGFDFLQTTNREVQEGANLHFDPESKRSFAIVYGAEATLPDLGTVKPGIYDETTGRSRQDAIEDVESRQYHNERAMQFGLDNTLKEVYNVTQEPIVSDIERETGMVKQGGYITLSSSKLDDIEQSAIDELKAIYTKRLAGLEQLREGLDNPEEGTYLADRLNEEFASNYEAMRMLNGELSDAGNTPRLRYERDKETGKISKWEFGGFNPMTDWVPQMDDVFIPSVQEQKPEVLPDKEFTDENVDYLTNLLGIDASEGETKKEPEPEYFEWKVPTDWDSFLENPLFKDMRAQGFMDAVYPYKGVSVEELGDFEKLHEAMPSDNVLRGAWGAALSKAKVSEKPITFSETTEVPVTEGSVVQSVSKDELPDNLSEEVRGYEDRKIELLEDLNKNLKNQQRSIVVGGGGDGGSVMMPSDMRMSVDDVGLSLVNMGFFD